jgi:hypothetical protein
MESMEIMDCVERYSLKLSTRWTGKHYMEAMERQDYVSESDVLPLDKSPILGFYAGD